MTKHFAVDGRIDVSLIHQSHVGGLRWINWVKTGCKPYHYDMVEVEAKNHLRLDYKVLKHFIY